MKYRVGIVVFALFSLSYLAPKTHAECVVSVACDAGHPYAATFTLTYPTDPASTNPFHSADAACTHPIIASGSSRRLCCSEKTETFATDSLRAPLCGASVERGKANATCWLCKKKSEEQGVTICDGLGFSIGETSNFIKTNREPIPGNDISRVWRVKVPPGTTSFMYNGMKYDLKGDLIACEPNNLACGTTDLTCNNIAHPDVTNRGGANACRVFNFQRTSLTSSLGSTITTSSTTKGCINIGDYSANANELDKITALYKENDIHGWIYIMAVPEWMNTISAFIGKNPKNNYMIRLHYPSRPLSPAYADQWVTALTNYAGNISTKVYLMPVNEPNNTDPRRHVEPETARIFISALAQGLSNAGLLNSKYILTSPMIDPFAPDIPGYMNELCAENFCSHFSAVAVAPYGVQGGSGLTRGDMTDIKAFFPSDLPVIAAETGLVYGGQAVYGPSYDSAIGQYLTEVKPLWNAQNVIASCIFSYNPDKHTDNEWIYSATETKKALFGLGNSIAPQNEEEINKPAVISNISYASCVVGGQSQTPSRTEILYPVDVGNRDSEGNLLGLSSSYNQPMKGEVKLSKNILKTPNVVSYGNQLEGAYPGLTPQRIQEKFQKRGDADTLSLSASGTLCVLADNGKIKTYPTKDQVTATFDGWDKVVGYTPLLSSMVGPNMTLSEYEIEHNAEIHPDQKANTSFDCADPPPGVPITGRTTSVPGGYEYDQSGEPNTNWPTILGSTISRLFGNLITSIKNGACKAGTCNTTVDLKTYQEMAVNIPYNEDIQNRTGMGGSGKETGFTNAFVQSSLGPLGNDHGQITHTLNQTITAQQQDVNIDLNYDKMRGFTNHVTATNCAVMPNSLQSNVGLNDCRAITGSVSVANTSDWAQTGTSPGPFTPSGEFADILKAKAAKYGVPECVMQGVARIEGGGKYKEKPLDACLNSVNNCSAAGPMQFTTGPNPKNPKLDCTKCPAGYCPNAWATYGNDGNPCKYEDALDAAAHYLSDAGNFTSEPASDQKKQIHDAASAYYGSDNNELARSVLQGCEYWEFVYKQCSPSYVCVKAK